MKTLHPKNILSSSWGYKMIAKKFFTINNIDYYLDKIFLEYEQPELFTVCNVVGGLFLVMLIDATEEKWLMTPISAKKLCELEYGKIYIKDAFVNPEINIGIVSLIDGEYFFENINSQDIKNEYLPADDARLNWNNVPMPYIQEDLYKMAALRQRDILDIRVISEETKYHTIDAKKLGSLLIIVNDTIKSIAKEQNRKKNKKRGLTAGCSLRYIGNYEGSFGIRLESEENSNLFDETKLTPVLNELFQLLAINDTDDISKLVVEKSFDYSKALRKLLKYSCDTNAELDFTFITPKATHQGKATWETDFSKNTLKFLDHIMKETVKDEEYIGDLVSVSTKQNNFTFITETEDEIKGKIDASLKEVPFVVKSHAKILVKRTIKITNANEIEEQFRLIKYEKLLQ